jgi:hypothetical protein
VSSALPNRRGLIVGLATLALLSVAPSASAESPEAILRDCAQDGRFDGSYSKKELRDALDSMPTDAAEYGSDCLGLLKDLLFSPPASRGGAGPEDGSRGGDAGAGDPAPPDPATAARDAAALGRAAGSGREPRLDIGGVVVEPDGGGPLGDLAEGHSLPAPLLAAVLALAGLTLVACAAALVRRIRGGERLSDPTPTL